jgi:prepilin-type N-terminal cleavage/methylation domain-containing protein
MTMTHQTPSFTSLESSSTISSKRKRSSRMGFTLIEVLVALSIIGFLASIVLASTGDARYRSYDVKRRTDLVAMETALQFYYNKHGSYPSTGGAVLYSDQSEWIPSLESEGFIKQLPMDPQYPQVAGGDCEAWPTGGTYLYVSNDGSGYFLLNACAANSGVVNTTSGDPFYDPARATWAWRVCDGYECDLYSPS